VPKISERQLLWLTIGTSVLVAGGVTGLVFTDRSAIRDAEEEAVGLEEKIRAADSEISKTRERENQVVVFREVAPRELEILPQRQQIADFHQNLSRVLVQSGASFSKLPESAPKESELAKGIFITANTVEFEADAASLLTFVNTLENDPRLVTVKGFKVRAGQRSKDESSKPPVHKVELSLETYYYDPPTNGAAPVGIPGYQSRLEDKEVRASIASFQPEKADSYPLRPSVSRRDVFVDVRKEVVVEDPETVRKRFEEEEKVAIDLERRWDGVREKAEAERVLLEQGSLFLGDRVAQEVDAMLVDLRVLLANVASAKSVTFPELETRVERLKSSVEALTSTRKDQPRVLEISTAVAQKTLDAVEESFAKGDYGQVGGLLLQWDSFLKGKAVKPEAQPILERVRATAVRAKSLSEFQGLPIRVNGVMVHSIEPSKSVALVNGVVVRVGDTVLDRKDVRVTGIRREGVEFTFQGERVLKPLPGVAEKTSTEASAHGGGSVTQVRVVADPDGGSGTKPR
jgi:hypothetical protein